MARLASAFLILGLAASAAGQRPMTWSDELPTWEQLATDCQAFQYPALEGMRFAQAHCYYLDGQRELNRDRSWWLAYEDEAHRRWECWSLLCEAQGGSLGYLIDLKRAIGEDAYRQGRMPAPAPFLDDLWR